MTVILTNYNIGNYNIGFIFAINDDDNDFILGNNSMITRFLFIYSNNCLNAFWKFDLKNGHPKWHDKISPLKPPISLFETMKTPL